MSKWTLEKILACEEIKFGTIFKLSGIDCVVIGSNNNSLFYIPKGHHSACTLLLFDSLCFYSSSGTEILPPKDKKKILKKFWVNFYECGYISAHTKKEVADAQRAKILNRIACEYFEREIEVNCE